jgi:hypothetical protein
MCNVMIQRTECNVHLPTRRGLPVHRVSERTTSPKPNAGLMHMHAPTTIINSKCLKLNQAAVADCWHTPSSQNAGLSINIYIMPIPIATAKTDHP